MKQNMKQNLYKKIKKVFFCMLLLLLFGKYSVVKAASGIGCNLNDEVIDYTNCDIINITSLENVEKLSLFNKINSIDLKNLKIDDISFLGKIKNEISVLNISRSTVNFKKFNAKVKKINIVDSIVDNSDFSGLASNSSLTSLTLDNSLVYDFTTLSSLSNLSNFSNLAINYASISIIDLTPITLLKNIKTLNLDGMEQNITSDIIDYVEKNNITTNSDFTKGPIYMNQLKEILDNKKISKMSDEDAIKEIYLYVTNSMTYTSEYNYQGIEGALNGFGVCSDYSLFMNALLELVGFKSLMVNGNDGRHAWNIIFLNGKWFGIESTTALDSDAYWIILNRLDIDSNDWNRGHRINNKLLYEYIPTFKIELANNTDNNIDKIYNIGSFPINMNKIPTKKNYYIDGLYYDNNYSKKYSTNDIINRDTKLYIKYRKIENVITNNNFIIVIVTTILLILASFIFYNLNKKVKTDIKIY